MHLLIVADWTFPCDEPFMREVYAKRWQEAGNEVTWVMRPAGESIESANWRGSTVLIGSKSVYGYRTIPRSVLGRSDWPERVWNEHGPFDIVQVRNDIPAAYAWQRVAEANDTPFVFRHSHLKAETLRLGYREGVPEYGLRDYCKGTAGMALRRPVLNRSDAVLTISDAMSEYHRSHGARAPLHAAPMGVDTTITASDIDPEPFCAAHDLRRGEYLVYIGSMNPVRRLEFLFRVLRHLRDHGAGVELAIVGGRNPERRRRLKQQAAEYGVKQDVVFTGWVPKTELQQAVRGAAVGLSPLPPNEVFRTNSPTKVLEYLNLGTPVAVTSTSEQQYVAEEGGGGIVADYTPDSFASAVRRLLDNPSEATSMGERGQEFVRQHRSYDRLRQLVTTRYRRLLTTK